MQVRTLLKVYEGPFELRTGDEHLFVRIPLDKLDVHLEDEITMLTTNGIIYCTAPEYELDADFIDDLPF